MLGFKEWGGGLTLAGSVEDQFVVVVSPASGCFRASGHEVYGGFVFFTLCH